MIQDGGTRDRGLAIIAALWATALCGIVAVSVMQLTRSDARLVRGRDDVAQLRALADAGINIAILSLLGPSETQPSVTGTPYTVRLQGREIRMVVRDEAGRIDLNHATPGTLRLLLVEAGLGRGEAEEMARRIEERRAPVGQGGGGQGGRGRGPFQTVTELRGLPGMTDALYARLRPLVTVYSQTPSIDPDFASAGVLKVFSGVDAGARAALRRREEVARGAAKPPRSPGVTIGHAFAITARIEDKAAGARATRRAVVRLTGQAQSPVLIYSWD